MCSRWRRAHPPTPWPVGGPAEPAAAVCHGQHARFSGVRRYRCRAMRAHLQPAAALSLLLLAAACDVVAPTNRFDPDTPADQQEPATLRGTLVLDDETLAPELLAAEFDDVTVSVLDDEGRALPGVDGAPLAVPLSVDGATARFGIELVPQRVRLAVTVPARFTDQPTLAPVALTAGAVVDLGTLTFRYTPPPPPPPGEGPCAISGTVALASGAAGERLVQVFRTSAAGQELVDSDATDADGAFSLDGLAAGTYAIAASVDDYTPDYRLDVVVADVDGQREQVFAGAQALTLHPVTAVLLPQLARVEGSFYTRGDSVDLAVLPFGGVTGMRLVAADCNVDCSVVDFAGAPFVPHAAAASVALPDVDGAIAVFAQFEVRDTFVFTSPVFSTTVVRDTTAPEVRGVSRLGAAPADVVTVDDDTVNVDVDAFDFGGVAGFATAVVDADAAAPDAATLPFVVLSTPPGPASFSSAVPLPAGDGVYDVYVFVVDRAGNRSAAGQLRVRKDTAAPDAIPLVIDAIDVAEGRAVNVHVHFDVAGATDLPVAVQLGTTLPADTLTGRLPFSVDEFVVAASAVDGETLVVQARLIDEVDNSEVVIASAPVVLQGRISGTIDVEQIGAAPNAAGTLVRALAGNGAVLASTTTDVSGGFVLAGVPEGRVTLVATRDGFRTFTSEVGFLEADSDVDVDALLAARRGALVGRARKQDQDGSDGVHGGISITVRLESQGRSALLRQAITGADGDWSLDLLPITLFGESYTVIASADGYAQGTVADVVVDENSVTVVNPDDADPQTPAPVLLAPLSGDFDVCSTAAVGGACAPLAFTNQDQVRVHLRSDTGVTRIRAAATALPNEAALPLVAYDEDVDVVVALPDVQGAVAVFVDVERDGGRQVLGPVQVFRDTVAPTAPGLVVARGARARADGFTNELFVRATVTTNINDDDDATAESPLVRAPVFFDTAVPTVPRAAGVALCASDVPCTVLLPSPLGTVDEGRHDLYAFACDSAGNCSQSAATDAIVFDRTPPSALHGVAFAPVGARVVGSGDTFATGSGAYAVDIDVGAATDAGGVPVVDVAGTAVADVAAVALSFVAAIDDDDAVDLVGSGAPEEVVTVVGLPLLGGEGDYDVFARFVDAAGNATIVEPNPFHFALTLDETAPSARLVLADGAALTSTLTINARVDDLSEAATVKFVDDAADCADDAGYSAATSGSVVLADAEGAAVVLACAKDAVGNVGVASDSIVVDRTAPVGSVVIDGGAAFSGDRNLVATFSDVSADVVRAKTQLRTSAQAALSCVGGTYNAFTSTLAVSIDAAAPAGTFVFEACFEDAAGNRSAAPASASVLFDATAPTATLTLNAAAAFTTSATVSAAITFSEPDIAVAPAAARFSSSLSFSGPTEAFAPVKAGLTVDAPTVEGSKQVCVEVTDALGRLATACDSITLDLSAPVGIFTVPTFATANPVATTVRSDDLNIASVAVGEAIDCSTATFAALARATTLPQSITVSDTTTEGTRVLVACFKDAAGNVSRVERQTTFDPADPTLAPPLAPVTGAVTSNRRPTFSWGAVPGAATYVLIVRQGAATVLTSPAQTGLSFTPTSNLPEASLTWIVVPTKASGRSAAQVFTGAPTLVVDATAPSAASGVAIGVGSGFSQITTPAPCTAAAPCLNDATPTVTFTAGSDALDAGLVHVVEVARSSDPTFGAPVATATRAAGGSFDLGSALEDGSFILRVRSSDDAGNTATSAVVAFSIDRTAPSAPSFLPLADPVSSALGAAIVVNWTAEGTSGAVAYRLQMSSEADGFAAFTVNEVLSGATNTSRDVRTALATGAHVRHIVRVAAIDALGNASSFTLAGFANDTTAPCSQLQQVRVQGSDAASDFTNAAAVVVEISCGSDPADPFDGPAKMQVGCDGTATGKPITAFTGVATCVLPNPDGAKTVAVRVFDGAGNSTATFSDTITLDRAAPTAPVLGIDEVITNNPIFSFAIEESSIDTPNNFLRHEFIDGVDIVSFADARAIVAGTTVALTLIDERTYNVRVRGVDRAGNASAEALAKVTFDITPPTAPNIADNDAPVVFNADTFTFFLDADADDLHFDHYELSENGGPFAEIAGDGTFTVAIAQDATTTLALRGVDAAGNAGDADAVVVVEDSRNPRPVALATLPPFVSAGPPRSFSTGSFTSRGAYLDIHFERDEIDVSAAAIDANFDHFEVRGPTDDFLNFVPLCAVATELCPAVVRSDIGTFITGADHVIVAGGNVVGFRLPVVRGEENTFTVRGVDRAGNVSVETSISTTDTSIVRATNDDIREVETSLFGDRLVTIDADTAEVRVHETGPDALLGTADDEVTPLRVAANAPTSVFEVRQTVAQGPDMVAQTFQNGPNSIVMVHGPGPDHRFATTGDNTTFNANDNLTVVGDETIEAFAPTIWQQRVAFVRQISGSDSDVIVREPGTDGVLGNADDRFSTPNNDAVTQRFPQLSGENLAYFRCNNTSCSGVGDPTLVVVNAGADRLFGSGDDVVRTLSQAVGIDPAIPLRLFTPGTPGRAACKNVIAYAGDSAHKGVFVISAGPDGLFDVDDTPVQVMNEKAQRSGNIGGFALWDDVVVASDGFAPPFLEVATGGRDGCLTRTADNLVFDSDVPSFGAVHSVHDGRIVTQVPSPTPDVVILDLGASRRLFPRNEGTASFANFDVDVDGVALGGSGVYDFATHAVQTAFTNFSDDVSLNRGSLLHASRSVFVSSAPVFDILTARERGIDGVWGTGDDRATVISGVHPIALDNNAIVAFAVGHSLDGDIAVWPGKKSDDTVVPVLHFAGADGAFGIGGDDCEVELSADEQPGYSFVRSSLRRQVFQACGDFGCNGSVGVSVREVQGDVCSGTSTTTFLNNGAKPDIDGTRVAYLFNGVRVAEPGPDGSFATVADNTDRLVSLTSTIVSQAPRISGDRVAFIDTRTETARVVVADLADGSERIVSRSATNNNSVSIEGDVVVFGSEVEGSSFTNDVDIAYLALEPDSPQDARNPAPTRQRCPDDDVFEENDSRLTATPMNSGAAVNGIACRGDFDHFVVDVPAVGCVVRAKTAFRNADGDLDLALLDPTDAIVATSTSTADRETITFTAARAGAHLVRVFGFGAAENSYDVGVTVTCP